MVTPGDVGAEARPISSGICSARGRTAMIHALHVSLRTTHASWVFLVGDEAWKVKRPVDFGFLDFRTRGGTARLLRGRGAPQPALRARRLPGRRAGPRVARRPRVRGDGPIVDWAVRMRRLPERASAAAMLRRGMLGPERLAAVAERLAVFLGGARVTPDVRRAGRPPPQRRRELRAGRARSSAISSSAPRSTTSAASSWARWNRSAIASPRASARDASARDTAISGSSTSIFFPRPTGSSPSTASSSASGFAAATWPARRRSWRWSWRRRAGPIWPPASWRASPRRATTSGSTASSTSTCRTAPGCGARSRRSWRRTRARSRSCGRASATRRGASSPSRALVRRRAGRPAFPRRRRRRHRQRQDHAGDRARARAGGAGGQQRSRSQGGGRASADGARRRGPVHGRRPSSATTERCCGARGRSSRPDAARSWTRRSPRARRREEAAALARATGAALVFIETRCADREVLEARLAARRGRPSVSDATDAELENLLALPRAGRARRAGDPHRRGHRQATRAPPARTRCDSSRRAASSAAEARRAS